MFEAPLTTTATAASRQCMSYVFSTVVYFEVCLGFAKGPPPPFLCTTTFYNVPQDHRVHFHKKRRSCKMQMKTGKSSLFLLWVELGDTMRVVKVVRLVPNALASEWKAAFYYVDWGLTCGTAKERARDDADECQNEDGGGATCRLPKTYCSFERVSDCQGGALQHATTRCKILSFWSKCILLSISFNFRLTSFEPNWKRKTKPSKRKLERPSMRHRRRTAFPTNSVICEIKLTSKTGKLTCCKER